MKNKKLFLALSAVCLANFVGHLFSYPHLPDIIPIHWSFEGVADNWAPKSTGLLLAALPLLMLLCLYVVPRIDPKSRNYEKHKKIWNVFLTVIILFFCAMTWLAELSVFGLLPDGSSLLSILIGGGIGILFILLGNYMPRIKQNYTFGCRTPWALADEHTWQRTQRMGGITLIVIGAALLVSGVFAKLLGQGGTLALILVSSIGGVLWIYLYSYLVYAKKMK